MMLSLRHCALAGSGIRSLASARPAFMSFVRTHHLQSFHSHCDVLPLNQRQEPCSSRLQPLNLLQLRSISTTSQRRSDDMAEPTGLIANSGIELLTWG